MELIKTYAKEIVALLVPFITWIVNTALKPRATLVWWTEHQFILLVHEPLLNPDGTVAKPKQSAHTQSLTVQNLGRETATKIEVVFNFKPLCLNIWPLRPFEESVESDGRYTIKLTSMAPYEHITFELLNINQDLPALLNVRSDQCLARQIHVASVEKIPQWRRRLAQSMYWVGIAATIYLAINLVQFLVLKTPLGYDLARGQGQISKVIE